MCVKVPEEAVEHVQKKYTNEKEEKTDIKVSKKMKNKSRAKKYPEARRLP